MILTITENKWYNKWLTNYHPVRRDVKGIDLKKSFKDDLKYKIMEDFIKKNDDVDKFNKEYSERILKMNEALGDFIDRYMKEEIIKEKKNTIDPQTKKLIDPCWSDEEQFNKWINRHYQDIKYDMLDKAKDLYDTFSEGGGRKKIHKQRKIKRKTKRNKSKRRKVTKKKKYKN